MIGQLADHLMMMLLQHIIRRIGQTQCTAGPCHSFKDGTSYQLASILLVDDKEERMLPLGNADNGEEMFVLNFGYVDNNQWFGRGHHAFITPFALNPQHPETGAPHPGHGLTTREFPEVTLQIMEKRRVSGA